MKINRLSPSSYTSWEGCQHRYFLEQNLKYTYPPFKKADMGTVAHKVLENLALIKLRQQEIAAGIEPENTKIEAKKDIFVDINNYTIEELTDLAISAYKEGFFDRNQISNIKKYINTAISARNSEYDPRNREIVSPEKRFKIEIPESWAKLEDGTRFFLSGIMDLVTKVDENTYEIIDWKCKEPKDFNTGAKITYASCVDNIQLRMYHWAATKIYGDDKNYLASIYFLETDDMFTVPYDNTDLPKTEYMLKERYQEIRACNVPKLNRSYKCKLFCPFGKKTTHGTNFPVMEQMVSGGIANRGEPMTICDCSNYHIHMYGIDFVQEHFSKYKKDNI